MWRSTHKLVMRCTLNLLAQKLDHYRKAVESRDAEVICLFINTHAAPARTFWIGALPIALNRIITQVSGTAPPSYLSVHRPACRPAASARNIHPSRAKRTWRGMRVMRVFVPQPPHCGTCARRKSDRALTSASAHVSQLCVTCAGKGRANGNSCSDQSVPVTITMGVQVISSYDQFKSAVSRGTLQRY